MVNLNQMFNWPVTNELHLMRLPLVGMWKIIVCIVCSTVGYSSKFLYVRSCCMLLLLLNLTMLLRSFTNFCIYIASKINLNILFYQMCYGNHPNLLHTKGPSNDKSFIKWRHPWPTWNLMGACSSNILGIFVEFWLNACRIFVEYVSNTSNICRADVESVEDLSDWTKFLSNNRNVLSLGLRFRV